MANFEHVRGHVWVGRGKDVRVDLKWERAMGKCNVHEAQFLI